MASTRQKRRKSFKTAIEQAIEQATPRNFLESVEIQIKLRDIDLDQPENRFTTRVVLPHFVANKDNIGFFASDAHLTTLEEIQEELEDEITIISQTKLNRIRTNPRDIKKLASKIRIFLASVSLMGDIGKYLGRYLSPRNKMPIPVAIDADLKEAIERAKRTVQIRLRDNPTIYCKIGHEGMDTENLADNAFMLLQEIIEKTPKREGNIEEISFKTTMGPQIEVE
ncbi:MAG: 50S ribosomal protein L1 [Candidatus Thorarchaeota archaeon]|nr:50S ribosomal protein L1 [Candidatus Thorarchaeota archaeon]